MASFVSQRPAAVPVVRQTSIASYSPRMYSGSVDRMVSAPDGADQWSLRRGGRVTGTPSGGVTVATASSCKPLPISSAGVVDGGSIKAGMGAGGSMRVPMSAASFQLPLGSRIVGSSSLSPLQVPSSERQSYTMPEDHVVVPVASAGVDTNDDGIADFIYIGADHDGDGIPDVLRMQSAYQQTSRGMRMRTTSPLPEGPQVTLSPRYGLPSQALSGGFVPPSREAAASGSRAPAATNQVVVRLASSGRRPTVQLTGGAQSGALQPSTVSASPMLSSRALVVTTPRPGSISMPTSVPTTNFAPSSLNSVMTGTVATPQSGTPLGTSVSTALPCEMRSISEGPPYGVRPQADKREMETQQILDQLEGLSSISANAPATSSSDTGNRPGALPPAEPFFVSATGSRQDPRSEFTIREAQKVYKEVVTRLEDLKSMKVRLQDLEASLTSTSYRGAFDLRPDLREIGPRPRKSTGGTDLGGSREGFDISFSEASVSGGGGHGPNQIGFSNQITANKSWQDSLNASKKTDYSRQWEIGFGRPLDQNRPGTLEEHSREPKSKPKSRETSRQRSDSQVRAEVDSAFPCSLRSIRAPAGKDPWCKSPRSRTSSPGTPRCGGGTPRASRSSAQGTPGGTPNRSTRGLGAGGEQRRRHSSSQASQGSTPRRSAISDRYDAAWERGFYLSILS